MQKALNIQRFLRRTDETAAVKIDMSASEGSPFTIIRKATTPAVQRRARSSSSRSGGPWLCSGRKPPSQLSAHGTFAAAAACVRSAASRLLHGRRLAAPVVARHKSPKMIIFTAKLSQTKMPHATCQSSCAMQGEPKIS